MSRKVLLIFPFLLLILHSPTAWSQGPEELLKVGAGAFEDGFWTVAETEWRRFLRLYPNHPKAPLVRYLLGRTLIEEGKVEEALRNLEAVKGVKGVDPAALHYWMAFCLGRLGRWKEAEVHLLRSQGRPCPQRPLPAGGGEISAEEVGRGYPLPEEGPQVLKGGTPPVPGEASARPLPLPWGEVH